MTSTVNVLAEITAERVRQDEKWGEQNHPDLSRGLPVGNVLAESTAAGYYRLPSADSAKRRTDEDAKAGRASWLAIAVEELAEACQAAAQGDTAALRTEVVQLAAVCAQWVEAIDRRVAR